ncbi:uncharacterized protein LOC131928689 [Physella acuta]|uniref:uncharacterized protein LOC131928689 n=1 Tax=Physella acuta TaxID=109671 RepID=UPI0027DB6A0E|nr:uncharacterized protein LOC131928689 [Physella acuta]
MMKIVILAALICICSGHLCLVSPAQRGTANGINAAGAQDCYLITPPCGGRAQNLTSTTGLLAGKNFVVTFQKNIDHFNSAAPGYFSVSLGADETSLKELTRVPDTSDPSLTLYSATIAVPRTPGNQVLQVSYVTNKTPPLFNQCSDVIIVENDVLPVG